MYFMGGGFGGPGCPSRGQYPRAVKNPLKPPPQPPPLFKFGSKGGFKQDIRFPKPPPPPPLDSAHLHATSDPGGGQEKGNPEAADQVLGLRTTWEPPSSDMCANTQESETLLQQGASRPPEGRLHIETHITARAAGQPAHPGSGGHTCAQAAHGEDSPWGPARTPRASPTTSPQQRGEGNEATKGDPPPPTGDPASAHAWRAPRSAAMGTEVT